MENNVTILILLALAAAPQPLARRRRDAGDSNATCEASDSAPGKPAPYQPEFVIPQPTEGSGQTPSPAPTAINPNSYRVGLQDEVKVTVFDEPDLSTMYRVDADGSISFPLIGRVQAAGTTLSELQQRITTMLSAGYIRNPQVRVEVNQYKSQFVYVIGEVRAPGKITMTGTTMTLLEALALAGSPTSSASNEVIVVHPNRPNAATAPPGTDIEGARITVNRKDLELGKTGQDVVLQDGDIINVPSAQHFYITGHGPQSGNVRARPRHEHSTGDCAGRRPERSRIGSPHQNQPAREREAHRSERQPGRQRSSRATRSSSAAASSRLKA